MNSEISLRIIGLDEDAFTISIAVRNISSSFESIVVVEKNNVIDDLIEKLSVLSGQIYCGICDIRLGEFGQEYANGAFQARFHFYSPAKLGISTFQQTEFFDFANRKIADEAAFHMITEPILLDNFIEELKLLGKGECDAATLVCI